MREKTLRSMAACLIVGMCCSNTLALSLFGPPVAELEEGQFGFGAEYSYSQQCIDFDYTSGSGGADFTKHNLKTDTLLGWLGYGVLDTWEGFVQVGGARARSSEDMERHKADGFVFGVGTKVTITGENKLKWGGIVQAKWADLEGDATGPGWAGDLELDIMELQVAIGPSYEVCEYCNIYGGPFWSYLDGEKYYEEPGWYEKYDMSNCSDFGGFIGAQINITPDAVLNLEVQMTEDDDLMALSFMLRY